jgi:hypothetical protein
MPISKLQKIVSNGGNLLVVYMASSYKTIRDENFVENSNHRAMYALFNEDDGRYYLKVKKEKGNAFKDADVGLYFTSYNNRIYAFKVDGWGFCRQIHVYQYQ